MGKLWSTRFFASMIECATVCLEVRLNRGRSAYCSSPASIISASPNCIPKQIISCLLSGLFSSLPLEFHQQVLFAASLQFQGPSFEFRLAEQTPPKRTPLPSPQPLLVLPLLFNLQPFLSTPSLHSTTTAKPLFFLPNLPSPLRTLRSRRLALLTIWLFARSLRTLTSKSRPFDGCGSGRWWCFFYPSSLARCPAKTLQNCELSKAGRLEIVYELYGLVPFFKPGASGVLSYAVVSARQRAQSVTCYALQNPS